MRKSTKKYICMSMNYVTYDYTYYYFTSFGNDGNYMGYK